MITITIKHSSRVKIITDLYILFLYVYKNIFNLYRPVRFDEQYKCILTATANPIELRFYICW